MEAQTVRSTSPEIRKPVGIWLRVSTEDQARGDSPEHHEKRARYYAESKDWDVKEVYHLEAVSGKSVMDHPEAQRMLKDVQRGHISALIFSKLARLARNTRELLDFADMFRSQDADLVSLQESIDTSTPAGRLFYTMIAAMAQWEREEIASRISASVVVRAKLGKPLNGRAPFGYHFVDKKLVINPTEGPIRRLIYELYLEHRRKKSVASILNDRGYRTREGHQFSDSTIQYLLRDPTAKGLHRANYSSQGNGKGRRWATKPESEWIWTKVDPLVSEELWTQCNNLLDANHRLAPRTRRPVSLFGGLAHCDCGAKMYVRSNSPKYVCIACKNKIPIVDLEEIYYQELKGFFLSPTAISTQIAKADQNLCEKEDLLRSLTAERDKLQAEVQRVYRLYVEEQISGDAFGQFFKPLEVRQKQLGDELPRLQAELDILKINHLSADKIVTEAKDLYGRWPSLNHEEKKKIVESITDKIIIGKGEISINLCYLPSSEIMTTEQSKFRSFVSTLRMTLARFVTGLKESGLSSLEEVIRR